MAIIFKDLNGYFDEAKYIDYLNADFSYGIPDLFFDSFDGVTFINEFDEEITSADISIFIDWFGPHEAVEEYKDITISICCEDDDGHKNTTFFYIGDIIDISSEFGSDVNINYLDGDGELRDIAFNIDETGEDSFEDNCDKLFYWWFSLSINSHVYEHIIYQCTPTTLPLYIMNDAEIKSVITAILLNKWADNCSIYANIEFVDTPIAISQYRQFPVNVNLFNPIDTLSSALTLNEYDEWAGIPFSIEPCRESFTNTSVDWKYINIQPFEFGDVKFGVSFNDDRNLLYINQFDGKYSENSFSIVISSDNSKPIIALYIFFTVIREIENEKMTGESHYSELLKEFPIFNNK